MNPPCQSSSGPQHLAVDFADAINRASRERSSNTPDFLLGEFLASCLQAYETAVTARDAWTGPDPLHPLTKATRLFFMFDVESVGLYGEGFAAGYVVYRDGEEVASERFSCEHEHARAHDAEDRNWVEANCRFRHNLPDTEQVRENLFAKMRYWMSQGATVWADCVYPVEALFLAAYIKDHPGIDDIKWQGPYPFYDVAPVLLCAGRNPLDTTPRLPDELPAHEPVADARHSARQLLEAVKTICK